MKWKRINSKKLFDHPRISLFEDEVQLPGGARTKYMHFDDGGDSGMVLALGSDGKFLLQKEYSYPPDEVLYQLPGGALNKDEDPEDGARREFAEETGLTGDLKFLGWVYRNNRRSSTKMHIYLATNLTPVSGFEADEEELFEECWHTEEEIERMISSNEIRTWSFLAGWSLYQAHKKTEP